MMFDFLFSYIDFEKEELKKLIESELPNGWRISSIPICSNDKKLHGKRVLKMDLEFVDMNGVVGYVIDPSDGLHKQQFSSVSFTFQKFINESIQYFTVLNKYKNSVLHELFCRDNDHYLDSKTYCPVIKGYHCRRTHHVGV